MRSWSGKSSESSCAVPANISRVLNVWMPVVYIMLSQACDMYVPRQSVNGECVCTCHALHFPSVILAITVHLLGVGLFWHVCFGCLPCSHIKGLAVYVTKYHALLPLLYCSPHLIHVAGLVLLIGIMVDLQCLPAGSPPRL